MALFDRFKKDEARLRTGAARNLTEPARQSSRERRVVGPLRAEV